MIMASDSYSVHIVSVQQKDKLKKNNYIYYVMFDKNANNTFYSK